MEDGKYHRTKIVWETASQSIKVFWDSEPTPKITKSVKMKTTLFAGNPYVYWGWTGSTGMEKNLQKIKLVNIEFKQKLNVSGNVAASTCADPTGAIDFTVLGGVEPLYYSWSNGATTQDIFSLVPGEYTVIVTDECGNAGSSKFIVGSVNVPPIIQCTANIVIDNTPGKCAADYVMYNIPQLTGGCSAALIKQIAGLPSGSTFPMGTTVNTFAITTAEGAVSNCSFTVTVQ